jgi:hypothetical protein
VLDSDWEVVNSHYRVFLDGQWLDVPDDAVLTQPNLYGLSIRLDFVIVLARVQDIEMGNTVNPKDDSFAINELICSTPRATRRVFQTSQT